MPVKIRPSLASVADETVESVIVRCGAARGTASMQVTAASMTILRNSSVLFLPI